jgi:hypothetical protein
MQNAMVILEGKMVQARLQRRPLQRRPLQGRPPQLISAESEKEELFFLFVPVFCISS